MTHKMAIASDYIQADAFEAIEFPHLANKYQVYGVPLTVINEKIRVEGAVPEKRMVQEAMRVMADEAMGGDASWHG